MGSAVSVSSQSKHHDSHNTDHHIDDVIVIERRCVEGYYRNNNGHEYRQTVFQAIKDNHLDLIELLLAANNHDSLRVLSDDIIHITSSYGNIEALELLVSAGFSVIKKNKDHRIPLHICSLSKSSDTTLCCIYLCLQHPRSINFRDINGQTPAHIACLTNNTTVLRALIEYKADLNIRDNNNETVKDLAKRLKHQSILEIINESTNMSYINRVKVEETKEVDIERIMLIWDAFFENSLKLSNSHLKNNQNEAKTTDASVNRNRDVLDWFDWILIYDHEYDDNDGYYVINKRTYDFTSLNEFLDRYAKGNINNYSYHNDSKSGIPRTVTECIKYNWMLFYNDQTNTTSWLNLISNDSCDYLPIQRDHTVRELNFMQLTASNDVKRMNSKSKNDYKGLEADQICSVSWVLVMYHDQDMYYYFNQITGHSTWNQPDIWDQIISMNNNWILCCYSDKTDQLFWWNIHDNSTAWYS